MINIDNIRRRATFSVLGKKWNFSSEKVQKNAEKSLKKCKNDILRLMKK